MKPLRVLALMHPQLVPPDSLAGRDEKEINTASSPAYPGLAHTTTQMPPPN